MMFDGKSVRLLLLLLVVLVGLTACSSSEEAVPTPPPLGDLPPPGENDSPAGPDPWAGSGFYSGEDAVWPDYIPEDIPVLEGEIGTLMEAPGSHVRLLYHGVSERQIEAYLEQLEDEGFQLQGIVYEDPVNPGRAQEKLEEGDYDAVDITKGVYRMRLEYGGDMASYDIYTQGFQIEGPAVEGPQWPEELAALPPPERCKLVTINPVNDGGYSITCSREDENVDADYIQLLQAQNYVEQERHLNQEGEIISLKLDNGQVTVWFSPAFQTYFTFTAGPSQGAGQAGPAQSWPAELAERVPPPERCDLSSVLSASPGNYSIWCDPQDQDVVQDYLELLQGAGFEEEDRFEDYQGELLSISLVQDDLTVELLLAFSPTLVIKVGPGEP